MRAPTTAAGAYSIQRGLHLQSPQKRLNQCIWESHSNGMKTLKDHLFVPIFNIF